MNKEEHKQRHIKLHKAFDELLADYLQYTSRLPSQATVLELLKWSHKQTVEVDHDASGSKGIK